MRVGPPNPAMTTCVNAIANAGHSAGLFVSADVITNWGGGWWAPSAGNIDQFNLMTFGDDGKPLIQTIGGQVRAQRTAHLHGVQGAAAGGNRKAAVRGHVHLVHRPGEHLHGRPLRVTPRGPQQTGGHRTGARRRSAQVQGGWRTGQPR